MISTVDAPTKTMAWWFLKVLRGLWVSIRVFLQFLLVAWSTLAVYYSNLPWPWLRLVLAIAMGLFGVWALWVTRRPRARWVYAGTYLALVAWFISIPPSHDRPWRAEVAVMPRIKIDGDRAFITGYRDFEFRSRTDFTPRYLEREVALSQLTSLDMYISYWAVGPVGHTFLSFNFENAPPVCISIETRPEEGEGFDPIASMFKQFELIYVVGDERDLVRSRTNYRNEEVFLYPLKMEPEAVRQLFLVYAERINELADHPEWYHLLKNNCSINIWRYKNIAGREGSFDIRHLLNGWVDRYFYENGLIDTSLPFAQLRERAHINQVARKTDGNMNALEFSKRIREFFTGAISK
jgi:hypothetical protein